MLPHEPLRRDPVPVTIPLKRLLEIQPGLTIAGWKTIYGATFLAPELLDVYVEGLRKAGLPEY
jgi:hypothetical protein